MDLFQIMCTGGCGKEPDAWYLLLRNIFNVLKIGVPIIFLLYIVYQLIISFDKKKKKRKTGKELTKTIVKAVIIVIAVFLILTFLQAIIALLANNPEYDNYSHCWC